MRKFKVGDSVRFKAGTRHADLDLDIGGWQGWVYANPDMPAADGIVSVLLDSVTLAALSADYIVDSNEEGVAWHIYFEEVANLERAEPRDTLAQTKATYAELAHRFRWAYLGEEGLAIQEIVQEADDDSWEAIQRWYKYFSNVLTFPFEAILEEWR